MTIRTPEDIYEILNDYKGRKQEHFLLLTLNNAHVIIKRHVITKGLVNRTIVHPREVFYPAIKDFASALVVAHNHPSGNTVPSGEDDEVTYRLLECAEILGFNLLDHLIISKGGFFSYKRSNCGFAAKFNSYKAVGLAC
jgi:DNA repair protein RadC